MWFEVYYLFKQKGACTIWNVFDHVCSVMDQQGLTDNNIDGRENDDNNLSSL